MARLYTFVDCMITYLCQIWIQVATYRANSYGYFQATNDLRALMNAYVSTVPVEITCNS